MTFVNTKPKKDEKLIFEFYRIDCDGRYEEHICYLILQPNDYTCIERENHWKTRKYYEIRVTEEIFEKVKKNYNKANDNFFDYQIKTEDELREELSCLWEDMFKLSSRASEIDDFLVNFEQH